MKTKQHLDNIKHRHSHEHLRDHHKNPHDLDSYIARLKSPARLKWQKPDEVVAALKIKPGQTIAEIGPGPGFFTFRLAQAVGPKGRVLAAEVEPKILDVFIRQLKRHKITNVTPILSLPADPLLPVGFIDLIFIANTFHHIPKAQQYLQSLKRALKPKGRIANIDFEARETPVGPPLKERISRELFLQYAKEAGYNLIADNNFLRYQYFLVVAPKRSEHFKF